MCPMSLHKGILKGLTILLDALKAFYPHFITPVYSLGRVRPMCFIAHQPFLEQPLGYNINVLLGS